MPVMYAGVQLEAGAASVTVEADGHWLIAFLILNRGDSAAKDVEVSSASLDRVRVVTPSPLKVGEIAARQFGTGTIRSAAPGGNRSLQHVLNVAGTYGEGDRRSPFSLRYPLSPFSSSGTTSSSATSTATTPGALNQPRDPDEPPGFAAANPTGPVRPMPSGKETSAAPPSDSAKAKIYTNAPVNRSDSSSLTPVQVKGLWGYAPSQTPTQIVIRAQFTHAMPFAEGLAAVAVAGKWGYIDSSGTFRIPVQFDEAASFAGGVARVTIGQRIRYIDPTGAFVSGPSR